MDKIGNLGEKVKGQGRPAPTGGAKSAKGGKAKGEGRRDLCQFAVSSGFLTRPGRFQTS